MRGLLFLLSVLFLLESTKGQKYDELNDNDRKIVDKAIEQGNKVQRKGKHLDFYEINSRHNNMLNVILRPTSCNKTTLSVHRKECEIHNKPPQVSCIDCNGTMKPCLFLKQKEEITKRINECRNPPSVNTPRKHFTGEAAILFRKGGNEPQLTGCLGCI